MTFKISLIQELPFDEICSPLEDPFENYKTSSPVKLPLP